MGHRLLDVPRRYCEWIANPGYDRCPRKARTGIRCDCQLSGPEEDRAGWPWRVVPPEATERDHRAYTYDKDGPFFLGTLGEYLARRAKRE